MKLKNECSLTKTTDKLMRIPTKFTLAATEWKVKVVDNLPDRVGSTDSNSATIYLEKNTNRQVMAQAFCHELLHAILYSTGRTDDHDELFVDGCAHYLHQFIEEVYGE